MKVEEHICEYYACPRRASEEIYTQIDKNEGISLSLCKECADKFKRSLERIEEASH